MATGVQSVTAIVLQSTPIGEYDRRLLLLTREKGKITCFARGASKPASPLLACSQQLAFGTFQIVCARSGNRLTAAEITERFQAILTDYDAMCHAMYFCEFIDYMTRENSDESEVLKLLYLALKALSKPEIGVRLTRAIFELKLMDLGGECPQVFHCVHCGREETLTYFHTDSHGVLCQSCAQTLTLPIKPLPISPACLLAMQHIVSVEEKRLFTFTVSETVLRELTQVSALYYDTCIDKQMKSLDLLQQ